MKHIWMKNEDASELLIFCNGWGMDMMPFATLAESEGLDVLMLYDYTFPELDFDLNEVVREYSRFSVVAWSLGVWAAAELFSSLDIKPASATAVAGTLEPISDDFGIPIQIFEASLYSWSINTRKKFERRMCTPSKEARDSFVSPERLPENQCNELMAIRAREKKSDYACQLFTRAVICTKDHIFPAQAQRDAWNRCGVETVERDLPHYPFFVCKSWRDVAEM